MGVEALKEHCDALCGEIARLRAELEIANTLVLPAQARRIAELEAAINAVEPWGDGDYARGWDDCARWIRENAALSGRESKV